jgi:hypothetical protein
MFQLNSIKPGARDGESSKIWMEEDKAEFLVDRGNTAMITRKVQCAWRLLVSSRGHSAVWAGEESKGNEHERMPAGE